MITTHRVTLLHSRIVRLLIIFLCTLSFAGCGRSSSDSSSPNILLLLIDDMGYNDLGANGNSSTPTPHLNNLANEGIRFTRFYADSTCSPARAALMTGRFPSRAGFTPDGPGISPQILTLPKALKQLGYTTNHVGKWHLGHISRQAWPDVIGFDTWFGFLSQWLLTQPEQHPYRENMFRRPSYINPWLYENSEKPEQRRGHLSDILVDKTRTLIQEGGKTSQPWFINHWFYLPHTPIQPAKRFAIKHADTPKGRYLATLEQLDDGIGKIIAALKETNQAENTLIIIASDNGGTNKQIDNNHPFFGSKAQYSEGGVRTPMIVFWPAGFEGKQIIDRTVSIMDIMPTAIRAAGGTLPLNLDGQDLTDLIQKGTPLKERDLFWEFNLYDQYIFSVLSSNGQWRASSQLHFQDPLPVSSSPYDKLVTLNDLTLDPSGEEDFSQHLQKTALTLIDKYRAWFQTVHELDLHFIPHGHRGAGILKGDDLQRSPGNGDFAFAISFSDPGESETRALSTLVDHPGIWRIDYESGNSEITVRTEKFDLKAKVDSNKKCQSIIFTGEFSRRLTDWKDNNSRIRASLYLNGQEEDKRDIHDFISTNEHLSSPTFIGSTSSGDQKFAGTLSGPRVFNAIASENNYLSPLAIHKQLCLEN